MYSRQIPGAFALIGQALFIFVALACTTAQGVNQQHALIMLTLLLVAIPIAFPNQLNAIAALVLVRGDITLKENLDLWQARSQA